MSKFANLRILVRWPVTRLPLALLLAALIGAVPAALHADVVAIGDVDPDQDPALPLFGGVVAGPVIVGIDGVGRLVIDVPAFTDFLVSMGDDTNNPGGVIGEGPEAQGEVVITGFDSAWLVEGRSLIGDQGLAILSLIGGSRFISTDRIDRTDPDNPVPIGGTAALVIGNLPGSSGIVSVDGFGSRLESDYMLVGRGGSASIDVFNRGNIITRQSASINVSAPEDIANVDFPDFPDFDDDPHQTGRVTVTGLGSRWTVADGLFVGGDGSDGNTSIGLLEILNQGLVQVGNLSTDDTDDDELLRVDTFGRVELGGGTLRALTTLTENGPLVPIDNRGVILGDGFVDAGIDNTGEIRNAAGIANLREKLLVSGPVVNNNLVESIGGEMEFLAPFDNTINGDLIFRDAIGRFQGGIDNEGEIVLGGDTTLYVNNITTTNTFLILPDTTAVIRGNLQFEPAAVAAFTVGSMAGTLDIIGTTELGDAFLSLDYSAGGVHAQAGDTYDILTAHLGLTGMFSNPNQQAVADGMLWDILYNGTTVSVTATGLLPMPLGADFNGDGIVDGDDLEIWGDNYGRTAPPDLSGLGDADGDGDVDGRDLLVIQRRWGMPGALTAELASVPEPSALVLSVILLGVAFMKRK